MPAPPPTFIALRGPCYNPTITFWLYEFDRKQCKDEIHSCISSLFCQNNNAETVERSRGRVGTVAQKTEIIPLLIL